MMKSKQSSINGGLSANNLNIQRRSTVNLARSSSKQLNKLLSMDRFLNLPVQDSDEERQAAYANKLMQMED